ncbi:hypothetical protein QJS04_geneDACA014514 [Acorus gramineus]|uniref:RRM domain-containing protein n=1 Tax=Acorus gramineus TaxID=55184 RepID=A0AAV9AS29_ACOGR|nr:hypothetical protein QJS04_geneDACA014514 [Acorus gramineus]
MAYQQMMQGSVSSGSGYGPGPGYHPQFMNSPFGDTTFTKVFVGGLAWETQSETMRRYFEQFGEILEAVVISDKNTGRSKGYGFREGLVLIQALSLMGGGQIVTWLRLGGLDLYFPTVGRPRSANPYFGGVQVPRYIGSPTYHQPVSYGYQQGFGYPPYSYPSYGPEYLYPQNVYNPYMGQQYLQVYGAPGSVSPGVYPLGQLGQPPPSGHGYTAVQPYPMPGHFVQLASPNVNGVMAAPVPSIQAPFPTGKISVDRCSGTNSSTTTIHSSCSFTTVHTGQQFRTNGRCDSITLDIVNVKQVVRRLGSPEIPQSQMSESL